MTKQQANAVTAPNMNPMPRSLPTNFGRLTAAAPHSGQAKESGRPVRGYVQEHTSGVRAERCRTQRRNPCIQPMAPAMSRNAVGNRYNQCITHFPIHVLPSAHAVLLLRRGSITSQSPVKRDRNAPRRKAPTPREDQKILHGSRIVGTIFSPRLSLRRSKRVHEPPEQRTTPDGAWHREHHHEHVAERFFDAVGIAITELV